MRVIRMMMSVTAVGIVVLGFAGTAAERIRLVSTAACAYWLPATTTSKPMAIPVSDSRFAAAAMMPIHHRPSSEISTARAAAAIQAIPVQIGRRTRVYKGCALAG